MNAKTGIGFFLARPLRTLALVTLALVGCGGDDKAPPATPTSSPSAAPAPTAEPAPSASASATASATASAAPPAPPPPKGKVASIALAPTSGKVDKVGTKDGSFKADGVKDLVFDVEIEGGPTTALLIVSTDGTGAPNGEFTADTFVGDQQLPPEIAANLNQGKFTAGLAVYEGDKIVNGKDGGIPALAGGKHKLTLHVSSKDASPKGTYKAIAVFDDKTMASSSPVSAK